VARVCLALALLASSTAHAGPEVAAEAPFTAEELGEALRARGVDDDVRVAAVASDAVEVTTRDGAWRVELGDARGAAAARIVALHLAVEPEAPVAGPPAVAIAPPSGAESGPPSTVAVTRAEARRAIADLPRWRVEGGVAWGAGVEAGDLPVRGMRLDVSRTDRRWRIAAGVGWLGGESQAPAGHQPLHADILVARVLAGVALGRFAIGAGPSAGILGADGGGHAGGLTLGLAAEARVDWPVGDRFSLFLGVDADALQRRVVGRVDGMAFAASPRLAVSALVGVGMELGE
jgi:hypothetical protein